MTTGTKYEMLKARLTEAFKELRREGYIARQNYLCCGNCAGYAIAQSVAAMTPAKRGRVQGAVFYHRQDQEGLDEWAGRRRDYRGRRGEPLSLYLKYGPVHADGTEYGRPVVETGQRLVQVLQAHGLTTDWDGTAAKCVEVTGLAEVRFDTLGVDLDAAADQLGVM